MDDRGSYSEGAVRDIHEVIVILKTAYRQGALEDEPEGARYIMISDTLARAMATALERYQVQKEGEIIELMEGT